MKNITAKIVLTSVLFTSSATVLAADKWKQETMDAWLDGKAETTLLLNTNLNSFDINTDVENKVVTLTGSVNNTVEKDLAEELIIGLKGIDSVNNELTVLDQESSNKHSTLDALTDTKVSTVVKTKLLMNSDVSGSDIDVDAKKGVVTLTGHVESDIERDLAIAIASNANDVSKVVDKLSIVE
jgi:osmotically-inducible protein OsmY